VAGALGIDLVWFGVMLCVNMQTSFLHPPFGFALFYLRGVAPKTVATKDIYLGAIPFLCLQLVLVGMLIFWPGLVTAFLPRGTGVDPASVIIDAPPPPDPSAAPPIIFN
jgi:TRAP-type mannitol/chloroaromatic compound transport system permease large subunit